MYVRRVDAMYQIGFGSPDKRSAALDPKLTPKHEKYGDIFSRYYISQFKLDLTPASGGAGPGAVGKFNGEDIVLMHMDKMYVSRPFWIPNATVMDIDHT